MNELTWRNRNELPELKRLNLKFDVNQLKKDVKILRSRKWNACIDGELKNLRKK